MGDEVAKVQAQIELLEPQIQAAGKSFLSALQSGNQLVGKQKEKYLRQEKEQLREKELLLLKASRFRLTLYGLDWDRKRLKLSTKDFTCLPTQFELPFRGRDSLMMYLARSVDEYFHSFATYGISKEEMLFVAIEGLSGVGKTRFLIEAMAGVGKNLSPTGKLARMYLNGAVEALYITFNGSAVGSSNPHSFPPVFETILRSRGPKVAGNIFMQACIASDVLYGEPFATLPEDIQVEILADDTVSCLKKLAAHVRKGLGIADGEMVALYLLVDESQMLGQEVIAKGSDGVEFLKGMFTWVGNVMTSTVGECAARQAGLAFIPLLGGTVLPVVGKYGISEWLNESITLEPLDMTSAVEILSLSVRDPRFGSVETQLRVLLDDCSRMPRLVRYIYSAWMKAAESGLTDAELVSHLRTTVVLKLENAVDNILQGNRAMVKRMVRLCLTGIEVETPLGTSLEVGECLKGYVYSQKTQLGVRYQSTMMLLHALCLRLGISNHIGVLRPEPSKGDSLEYAFLDMLHARMRVYEGTERSVCELFSGATGDVSVLEMKVEIRGGRDNFVKEKYQFYNPREKRFYISDDSYAIGDRGYFPLPWFGDLFKCREGVTVTDGRLFLKGTQGEVYELWIQLKGQKTRISVQEANDFAAAAFNPKLNVEGRRKIYVLCSRHGFVDVSMVVLKNVLLLDLQNFMPDYLRRSFPPDLEMYMAT